MLKLDPISLEGPVHLLKASLTELNLFLFLSDNIMRRWGDPHDENYIKLADVVDSKQEQLRDLW